MLAKQDTPIKARRTLLGLVPARYRTRVIKIRSMFVLLNADEIVKPPISNMMVGENMREKTLLEKERSAGRQGMKTVDIDIRCSLGSSHPFPIVCEHHSEPNQQEWHEERSDEKGNSLRCVMLFIYPYRGGYLSTYLGRPQDGTEG